jgi:hypothetical protein
MIFLAQDARLRPVLQSHNPESDCVTTTTPPYYSATTYHLRQIYGSTVALKSAPSNLRFTVVLLAEPALWLPCILPLPQEL